MILPVLAVEAQMWWRRSPGPVLDELSQRLQSGDSVALGQAYDLHHAAVRAFARRLLGDADAAEDLVQDVFVTLPKAIRRFDGRSALRTFVLGIAVRHAQHHQRALARRQRAWRRSGDVERTHSANPEAQCGENELAAALARALEQLPIDQRAAFVLCEIEERTAGEVATIVDAPEATVRTRLFHARKKLREALEREGLR